MSQLNLPRRARLHVAVGRGLDHLWPSGAAWAYRDALRWAPGEPELHVRRAAALDRARRWLEAAGAYRSAVRLSPRNIDYRAGLAVALHRAHRGEELVTALEELVGLRPDEGELWVLLGAVLAREDRRAEALRVFRWAVRLSPGHERRRFVLGETLLGRGGWAAALASWHEARELDGGAGAAGSPSTTPGGSVLHQHPGRRRPRVARAPDAPRPRGLPRRLHDLLVRLGLGAGRVVTGDPKERRIRALRRAWRRAHPRHRGWPLFLSSLRRRAPDASG